MLGPVELVDEIDSTNRELMRRAAAGAMHGSVLVARHQTAGRGRRDRRWEAPSGSSLLVSVLLRPTLDIEDVHLVTFAAGLAAVDACAEVAGVELALKWPNDVIVDGPAGGHKVAGLLAESVLASCRIEALVVGMGLNVNWPSAVPDGGAALNQLVGHDIEQRALLDRWLDRFGSRYEMLATEAGREAVLERYRQTCSTIGRVVRVEVPGEVIEGVADDVDRRGHLVVDGRSFAVGDVVHVRDRAE